VGKFGQTLLKIIVKSSNICSRSTLDKVISGRAYTNLPVYKNGEWTN